MTPTTAILLFSRTAATEAAEKPLLQNTAKARRLAVSMVEKTHLEARKTQMPVFIVSEKGQRGNSFGEKFYNAFTDIFSKGFESVIAIGNDCLSLEAAKLKHTATALTQGHEVVLGETTDGGVYVLGLTKKSFQTLDFQEIPWQTASVFEALVAQTAAQNHTIFYLSKASDIDSGADLIQVYRLLKRSWQHFMQALFETPQYPLHFYVFPISTHYSSSYKGRAP